MGLGAGVGRGAATLAVALTAPPRAAQVGKTSLILSLVGEEFPEEVRPSASPRPRRAQVRAPPPSALPGCPHGRVCPRSPPGQKRSPFPRTSPQRRCPPTSWITQVEGPPARGCAQERASPAGLQWDLFFHPEAEQTVEELQDEIHKVQWVLGKGVLGMGVRAQALGVWPPWLDRLHSLRDWIKVPRVSAASLIVL